MNQAPISDDDLRAQYRAHDLREEELKRELFAVREKKNVIAQKIFIAASQFAAAEILETQPTVSPTTSLNGTQTRNRNTRLV